MRVLSVEEGRALAEAQRGIAADAYGRARVAEVLRAEVRARGQSWRRSLVDAVAGDVLLGGEFTADEVRAVLDALESLGDVVVGPGGQVAPGPLRVVRLDGRTVSLIGGVETSALERWFGRVTSVELVRRASWSGGAAELAALGLVGARLLELEAWAGLDRAPTAAAWLATLTAELESAQRVLALGDVFEVESAQRYDPLAPKAWQHLRWVEARSVLEGVVLFRARGLAGRFGYALLRRLSAGIAWLSLSQDEARRAVYALDVAAGTAVAVRRRPLDGGLVEVGVQNVVPRAEHRWLLGAADVAWTEGFPLRYAMPAARAETVLARLVAQLGVRVEEVSEHG